MAAVPKSRASSVSSSLDLTAAAISAGAGDRPGPVPKHGSGRMTGGGMSGVDRDVRGRTAYWPFSR